MSNRPRTAELLAAYASGAELSDEERAAVEALLAQSADARDELVATRALLDDLRTAAPEPPPATEAMVRAVRLACAEPEPWSARARAWLRRRWALAVPAVAAAVALAVIGPRTEEPIIDPSPSPSPSPYPSPSPSPSPVPIPGPVPSAVWLDGAATALDGIDPAAAAEIDDALGAELAAIADGGLDDTTDGIGIGDGLGLGLGLGYGPGNGIGEIGGLGTDLGWVDQLDDDTAAELDRWLAEQPS